MRNLTEAETATLLCALRNHQINPEWHGVEKQDQLTDVQIDSLCDAIGTTGQIQIAL